MKIHAPCGDVYLENYVNVDIVGKMAAMLPDNPNVTTLDAYYKRPLDLTQHQRPIIVDMHMDLTKDWIFASGSAEEVLVISSIEHFLLDQAKHIVAEAYRVLAPGGRFVFDFPDILGIVEEYAAEDPDMMARMIYCSHKNDYSIHKWCYTAKSARQLLVDAIGPDNAWAEIVQRLVVQHDYPMVGMLAIK